MHLLSSHGAQIDQQPALVFGAELFWIYVLRFVFFFLEIRSSIAPDRKAIFPSLEINDAFHRVQVHGNSIILYWKMIITSN